MIYMIKPTDSDLVHYGKPHNDAPGRGSGRYAWGSGKNPQNGVTSQTVKTLNKDSKNKSGVDIQVARFKKNIATNNGTSAKSQFSTVNNMHVVNKIAKDDPSGNCALCTYAMDLREKGHDVRAKSTWDAGNPSTTDEDIASWYKNKDGSTPNITYFPSRFKEVNHPRQYIIPGVLYTREAYTTEEFRTGTDFNRWNANIKSTLLKGGEGSYGHLFVDNVVTDKETRSGLQSLYGWSIGGHDVFYKVANGEIMVYDGQNDEYYPYDEYIRYRIPETMDGGKIMMLPKGYLRTDNLDLNEESGMYKRLTDDIVSANSNYSPSNKTIDKIKSITQYSPPYVSSKKEIMQYTPPYQSSSAIKAMKKAANTVKNTSIETGSKISNTFNKIKQSLSNIKMNWTKNTGKLNIKDIIPKKK